MDPFFVHTVPRQPETAPAQPPVHYYVTSYGTTTFGPSSIHVTRQVGCPLPLLLLTSSSGNPMLQIITWIASVMQALCFFQNITSE